jgi:phosphoglycolate phosphatase-like HAD superfamily hydrolase
MSYAKLRVKGIMLDLDGTILDTRPAYIEAARIACQATGQEPLADDLALEIPKRMEQRQAFTGLFKSDPKVFLQAYRQAFYNVSTAKTIPMLGVAKTLEVLACKVKLAVITMRFMPAKAICLELKQFNLDGYFEHVVTALDTLEPKPSPEALIKAVAAMELQMCDCVIVGDSTVDVKAGKAAGAKTVAVLTGLYSRAELAAANPGFIISNISELPAIIT